MASNRLPASDWEFDVNDLIKHLKNIHTEVAHGFYLTQSKKIKPHYPERKDSFPPKEKFIPYRQSQNEFINNLLTHPQFRSFVSPQTFLMCLQLYNALVLYDAKFGTCEEHAAFANIFILNYLAEKRITEPYFLSQASTCLSLDDEFDHAYIIISKFPLESEKLYTLSEIRDCLRMDFFNNVYRRVGDSQQSFINDTDWTIIEGDSNSKNIVVPPDKIRIKADICFQLLDAVKLINDSWEKLFPLYEQARIARKFIHRPNRPTKWKDLFTIKGLEVVAQTTTTSIMSSTSLEVKPTASTEYVETPLTEETKNAMTLLKDVDFRLKQVADEKTGVNLKDILATEKLKHIMSDYNRAMTFKSLLNSDQLSYANELGKQIVNVAKNLGSHFLREHEAKRDSKFIPQAINYYQKALDVLAACPLENPEVALPLCSNLIIAYKKLNNNDGIIEVARRFEIDIFPKLEKDKPANNAIINKIAFHYAQALLVKAKKDLLQASPNREAINIILLEVEKLIPRITSGEFSDNIRRDLEATRVALNIKMPDAVGGPVASSKPSLVS